MDTDVYSILDELGHTFGVGDACGCCNCEIDDETYSGEFCPSCGAPYCISCLMETDPSCYCTKLSS